MNRAFGAVLIAGFAALQPVSSWACAACYGASDAPMAQGMNWGIISLLGIIGCVLVGVAGFFIYLARRASSQALKAAAIHGAVNPTKSPIANRRYSRLTIGATSSARTSDAVYSATATEPESSSAMGSFASTQPQVS